MSDYRENLSFLDREINGTKKIFLLDAMIGMSVLLNKLIGVRNDRTYTDSLEMSKVYEFFNKDENDWLVKNLNEEIQYYAVKGLSPNENQKILGNTDRIFTGDLIVFPSHPSEEWEVTKVTEEYFETDKNFSSLPIPNNFTIKKKSTIIHLDEKGEKKIQDIYQVKMERLTTIADVIEIPTFDLNTKEVLKDEFNKAMLKMNEYKELLNIISNPYEYKKALDFIESSFYSKYNKTLYENPDSPGTYFETINEFLIYYSNKYSLDYDDPTVGFIRFINLTDVENSEVTLLLPEIREETLRRFTYLINACFNFIESSEFALIFANQNYLFRVKQIIYMILNSFKSYAQHYLTPKINYNLDEDNTRVLEESFITKIFNIHDTINLFQEKAKNVILNDDFNLNTNFNNREIKNNAINLNNEIYKKSFMKTSISGFSDLSIDKIFYNDSELRDHTYNYEMKHFTRINATNLEYVTEELPIYYFNTYHNKFILLYDYAYNEGLAYIPTRDEALSDYNKYHIFFISKLLNGKLDVIIKDKENFIVRNIFNFDLENETFFDDWRANRISDSTLTSPYGSIIYFRRPDSLFYKYTRLTEQPRVFLDGEYKDWVLLSSDQKILYGKEYEGYIPSRLEAINNFKNSDWIESGYEFYHLNLVSFNVRKDKKFYNVYVFLPSPYWEINLLKEYK